MRKFSDGKKILVTGGAGFIGSAFIRHVIKNTKHEILNIDKLTYASNLVSLSSFQDSPRYTFKKIDICDPVKIKKVIEIYQPQILINLAAESHVDRSIEGPDKFIKNNINGTFNLLESSRDFWTKLDNKKRDEFRFLHVSTDEVFGDLKNTSRSFNEKSPYAPSSPYSASKAASDHLVRAWYRTYNLPTLITNCSNNYGPFQFPEKLIPLIINRALKGKNLPVYGNGKQIRDWIYVDDHVKALLKVATYGKVGESYNIGGNNQLQNIEVVKMICSILDEINPSNFSNFKKYEELITFVEDRAGHDIKYAIDPKKIYNELNWKPNETFSSGIRKTVEWYMKNVGWCNKILNDSALKLRNNKL